MNYFVVSPNVYNDGNIDYYLNEMMDRKIVIMGYSKDDGNKWVNMFANTMKIGDCVIVARGANWQKMVFFSGIISSDAMPYTETGESMYRDINYLTVLDDENIPFNTDCAFGASRQSGSIYQLKPDINPADRAVTDRVAALIMQTMSGGMKRKREYSLKEISTWPNAIVSIPGVQRGLVWKPAQVELLWDSILRCFPIGTFTLSESDTTDSNSQYYLMDGQQRFNAIALGFSIPQKEQGNSSIIWLDINPQIPDKSTRKYLVRLTNLAHPWGFSADDGCSTLSSDEKRGFLDCINHKNVYEQTLNPIDGYPYKANKPVPLSWLLNAPTKDENAFCDYLVDKLKGTDLKNLPYGEFTKEDIDILKNKFFNVFKSIKLYRVGVSIISSEAIDKTISEEKGKSADQPEALEVLFRRIGTGGTQITQEELNYSAIKAYWPKELREENDRVAEKYMNPERLVRLAFRLVLTKTDESSTKYSFKLDLPIQQIRKIAQNKGKEYEAILKWYENDEESSKISRVMDRVNCWLTYDNCPKFLRTSIARNSPDVCLLMMFLASREEMLNILDSQILFLQSIAYYLHWFADKNKGKCVDIILDEYLKSKDMRAISSGFSECIRQDLLPLVCPPDEMKMQINSQGGLEFPDDLCGHTWSLISNNREMLLYAQREYLNIKFPNYDPAKRGMWEQHNRPWDLDHIVPQDWISNKHSKYREYCKKWLWRNGNFAAIPFEANRSKSNQSNWKEYEDNEELLFFDKRIKEVKSNVTADLTQSNLFGEVTFNRTKSIYEECYKMLSRAFYGGSDNPFFSMTIRKRKELLKNILDRLRQKGYKADIRWTDNKYSSKEFIINVEEQGDDLKWSNAWLTVGFTPDDTHYICVCTQDINTIEIGVRKHPNTGEINGPLLYDIDDYGNINEGWWYIEKDISLADYFVAIDVAVKEICDNLINLNKNIKNS